MTDPRELRGGASRDLWAFDAIAEGGAAIPLVLLRTRATGEREWQALRAAHAHGVPVAEPLWRTAEGTGIVMRRLEGEALPPRLFRDEQLAHARAGLLPELARALAAIHRVPLAEVPAVERERIGPDVELDAIERELGAHPEPHPALEVGLRWLRGRTPPRREPVLLHGDFRIGNVLVGPGGLGAVLDWELVHAGDPLEDLGWMCIRPWRFGRADRPAAGLGSRRELCDAYAAAGGAPVDPEELRFWETLGNLRWGAFCLRQADKHLRGDRPSLEHAMIGRRACEAEWDLLAMIP
jgi:aminoglycoside phosphotransferase (APT) family kinase protein